MIPRRKSQRKPSDLKRVMQDASKREVRRVSLYYNVDDWRLFKMACAHAGKTATQVMGDFMVEYVNKSKTKIKKSI